MSIDAITQEKVLKLLFDDMWQYAHVCSFVEAPEALDNTQRSYWAGNYYKDYNLRYGNQFLCVSTFAPTEEGKSRRRKANFSAQYFLMIDDIGEKTDPTMVAKLPDATIELDSSLNSSQWFYKFTVPCTDQDMLDNLTEGMIAAGLTSDNTDPGMRNTTRYGRLPGAGSVNTKAKRVAENNGTPPEVNVTAWRPDNTYTVEELAAVFDIDLHARRKQSRVDGATSIPDHPILKYLDIKSELSPGRYDIVCPKWEEHSHGDKTGTAVFTNDDFTIGFKCMHGSHQAATVKDLLQWLGSEARQEYKTWRDNQVINSLPVTTTQQIVEPDFMGHQKNTLLTRSSKKLEFKDVNYTELLYIKWVLNGFLAEGFICIAGLPGIGKSSSIMSLALVVAGFGGAVNANVLADRDRVVIYVSEDTDQLQRQLYGYCDTYNIDAERLKERLKLVDARRCTLEELAEELSALIKVVDGQCQDTPLLILDTASSLFELENENDNSQVARFLAEIKNQIYELLGCPIWLITHAAKTSSRDASDITPRGASAYMGDVTGTASICEQHGQKVMTLGKTRVTPEYTEIVFESQIKTVFTVDDREQPQTQSLWLVVPKQSSQEARKQQAESDKEKQSSLRIDDQAKQVILYIKQQLNEYEVITIKSGKGGSQTPPDELKATKLLWSDVLTQSLSFTPQTKDEKEIKVRVLTLFPTDKSSPNGWHVWSSKVPKGDKGFPKDKTLSNLTFLSGRGEH